MKRAGLAGARITQGPSDWQILQRRLDNTADIPLAGTWLDQANRMASVEVRVVDETFQRPAAAHLDWQAADATNPDRTWRHVLENVVYLELLRRGNDVYVGQLQDGEVDFVAQNSEGVTYFQVAATVLDENTLRRELSSLEKIHDHYPKILLTLDDLGAGTTHNGIKQLNALDWLLSDDK